MVIRPATAFRLGGIGCLIVLAGILCLLTGMLDLQVASQGLIIVGGALALLGVIAFGREFASTPALLGGGIVYTVALLDFVLPLAVVIMGLSPMLRSGWLSFDPILALIGWIGSVLLGVGLILARRRVSESLGRDREGLVSATGALLMVPVVRVVALVPLASLFLGMAEVRPVTQRSEVAGAGPKTRSIRAWLPIASVALSALDWVLLIVYASWILPTQTYASRYRPGQYETTPVGQAYSSAMLVVIFAAMGVGFVALVVGPGPERHRAWVGFVAAVLAFVTLFVFGLILALGSIE